MLPVPVPDPWFSHCFRALFFLQWQFDKVPQREQTSPPSCSHKTLKKNHPVILHTAAGVASASKLSGFLSTKWWGLLFDIDALFGKWNLGSIFLEQSLNSAVGAKNTLLWPTYFDFPSYCLIELFYDTLTYFISLVFSALVLMVLDCLLLLCAFIYNTKTLTDTFMHVARSSLTCSTWPGPVICLKPFPHMPCQPLTTLAEPPPLELHLAGLLQVTVRPSTF